MLRLRNHHSAGFRHHGITIIPIYSTAFPTIQLIALYAMVYALYAMVCNTEICIKKFDAGFCDQSIHYLLA